jgi:hypothetical protein
VARNLATLTKALPEVVVLENDTVVIGAQRFMHDFSTIRPPA